MKLSERIRNKAWSFVYPEDRFIVSDEVAQLEVLVDEQNKLLDTLRRKLDELEQEIIYKLKADKRLLMHVVHGRAMASSLPKHLKEE